MRRLLRCFSGLGALVIALALFTPALAASPKPGAAVEEIRSALVAAQLASDPANAKAKLGEAAAAYALLAETLTTEAPGAAARTEAAFAAAESAVSSGDPVGLAVARGQIWTSILDGSYLVAEQAIRRNDASTALIWLSAREFRHATRFSRPNTDATMTVVSLRDGQANPEEALAVLRADLLDTYQARMNEALDDVLSADRQGFANRRAEAASLADGYFAILSPAYQEQRGEPALAEAQSLAAALVEAARTGQNIQAAVDTFEGALAGFRAAPLSSAEQTRRAGQLLRFLSLVPIEYGRGIRGGVVAVDLEIREATTFRDGAAAAFADLRSVLDKRDPVKTAEAGKLLDQLGEIIAAANTKGAADPGVVDDLTARADKLLRETMPQEWQRDNGADFDVIQTALDQMESAVTAGEYDLAESARIEAYAILESGPEAKLIVFAPDYKVSLENLFWYGSQEQPGLAAQIAAKAPASTIKATRKALDAELAASEKAIAGNNAPAAVGTNAAVIVFREGLEAVLILASLMGSLKTGAQRTLRRPLWAGTALAFLASALTWVLAQGALTALARYGERLEAVVSLIAIAVLLVITNWFFHDVYWKGWISNFHTQKRRIIGGASQFAGLLTLGFASVYREGFETVLFLQALVLEAGIGVVLAGTAAGLLGTVLVGLIVFGMQARLPYKRMLIVTGIFIGAVLLQMVGNTAHVMQVIGWLPIHPIREVSLPTWVGFWLGLYATWEGIILQALAGSFVIGSYYLAEHMHHREQTTGARLASTQP